MRAPALRGLRTLDQPDRWWRDAWAQSRSADELAARFGLPVEDVTERVRTCGLELRGRPPEGQRVMFELPARVVSLWDVRVTLDDGRTTDVVVEALTRRQSCVVARAEAEARGDVVAVCRGLGRRRTP